ncbi:MAG: hypothetical protein Q7U80_10750, partial [Thiobacillus sp.]|nr:hypothetical protein [Thiobacillus sp.]
MDQPEQQTGATNDNRSLVQVEPKTGCSARVTPLACQPSSPRAMALNSPSHPARPAESRMNTQEFKLSGEYIALCDLL